ncbi:MAG: DegT/DnrJ/EryC1/StrS family aminotransferase [Desulfobacterales bacterium]|nr:DegT/DnrJ/EryC1/StrS family aminotransferase [Desulfobacterales bacterium]
MTAIKTGQLRPNIPHSRPTLGPEEARRVAEVIRSGHLAPGDQLQSFEQTFAENVGKGSAAGVSSGTAALHLVLIAMGVGPADEVIIPSYVCTALLNAVRYVGARPVLSDIDPETHNMDPDDAKKRITRHTRAMIVPHMFGLPADMERLKGLNVPIIEDCAQAVGSSYAGKSVGTFGQAAIFSFYATKVITTGEGGMVVSGSKKIIERIKDLRDYDEKRDYKIRYNYKMTDIAAALGSVQLKKLETFIRNRRRIARHYDDFLKDLNLKLPPADPGRIYFRYVVGLDADSTTLIQQLQKKGIMCAKPVNKPLHQYLKQKGFTKTDTVWRNSVSLPIYPGLTRGDADRVLTAFTKCLRGAGR